MPLKSRTIACAILGLFLLSTTAFAKPPFMKQYAAYYKGSVPKCATCHSARHQLNDYGAALKVELNGGKALTPAMFKACDAKAPKS